MTDMHEPGRLPCLLAELELHHLTSVLRSETLGSLFLRCEDRVQMLSNLREIGVAKLADRQRCVNAISKLRRASNLNPLAPAAQHPIMEAPHLVEKFGRHCGTIGLLIKPDSTCYHVNEEPGDHYGSHTFSVGLQQPKLDGPIVAELARVAPLVGHPVFYPMTDEDPFVVDPGAA